MTDERNFRSSYYEKVGCRGVEEKKSLEILMKEKPWDKVKLKQFCLRFTVPAAYRNIVWKVLLGNKFNSLLLPAYNIKRIDEELLSPTYVRPALLKMLFEPVNLQE